MRARSGTVGFTISVLCAVAVTAALAFVFDASFQIVVSMLVLGLFTAIAEYVMRSRDNGGDGGSER